MKANHKSVFIGFIPILIIALLFGSYLTQALSFSVSNTSAKSSSSTCPNSYPTGAATGSNFFVAQGSTLTLCVRFFYYGPQVVTFNSNQFISLDIAENFVNAQGFSGYGSTAGNANSYFLTESTPPTFEMGGNSNLNEGIIVIYRLTPIGDTEGTFMLGGFGLNVASNNQSRPVASTCFPEFLVTVGIGNPNEVLEGGCLNDSGPAHYFDGMANACPLTNTCTEIVGSWNDTMAQ